MTRKEALKRGIKIVAVRWIDINKGDSKTPLYRSRLVAKEFNENKDDKDKISKAFELERFRGRDGRVVEDFRILFHSR